MSKAKETAQKILDRASQSGWTVTVKGSILEISKPIRTEEDFVKADSEYYWILGELPSTSPGSIWGTDGGGVGALSAMKNGLFVMKKSGGSKRVLNALAKMI